MAQEQKEKGTQQGEHAAKLAHADAAHREAYDYWGYLFKPDKCGTPLLDRLLRGIATTISKKFEPNDSPDLTPPQLAAYYRDVGGDYDLLFTDTPSSSIAFIYKSLGAFHSLQPAPGDDGYSSPTVPALKPQGFVTWQTVQLLLGPEEHVPFLQKAVEKYDIVDSETKSVFPKILPRECFPERPDAAMEAWYEGVANRLKQEAEEEVSAGGLSDEPRPRASTDTTRSGSSTDEKSGAYKYFEDPMYRNVRARPTIMRHVSKQSPRPSEEQGKSVTSRVRHMLNPWSHKQKTVPGRYESDSGSDSDATPTTANPSLAPRYVNHKRPHAPRRESSLSMTSSDSDSAPDNLPARRRQPVSNPMADPVLRTRRSHEPTVSQPEYFPQYEEARRYSHSHHSPHNAHGGGSGRGSNATSPQQMYRPTQSPLFATQVAQAQQRQYYDHRRPTMPPRTSYKPVQHGVRWENAPPAAAQLGGHGSVPVIPPRELENQYAWDRERQHRRDYEHRDHDHRHAEAYDSNSSRSRRRRSTEDAGYPREREKDRERERDVGRTRSHDRVRDEWDEREREPSRERDRRGDRDRDRDRAGHRYVAGVMDGVSGRRYPVSGGAGGSY